VEFDWNSVLGQGSASIRCALLEGEPFQPRDLRVDPMDQYRKENDST
jgi:hypothetical protein